MTPTTLLNDRYQLQETIGTGGMALVYKAKDLMLERYVGVKVLREDFTKDIAFRERFRQEARAAANLSHPNIVTVHDFGLDQGHLFIVMEYVPGTDLKTSIKQKSHFTVTETLDLMIQACQGIGYAHRAGLVHCDVKPHNFLVSPDGRLKVTDFGIARALASIVPDERSEIVWGSPHYFSPEQASGLPPSPASDVYSIGVILYEMLTGRVPFIASESSELARMHREEKPVSPLYYNPEIPQTLVDVILKVLSKEPSARYRTADQLGRVLQSIKESGADKFREFLPHEQRSFQTSSASSVSIPPIKETEPRKLTQKNKNIDTNRSFLAETGDSSKTDLGTWLLGLAAFAMLFGLIPFWLYVYLTLKP